MIWRVLASSPGDKARLGLGGAESRFRVTERSAERIVGPASGFLEGNRRHVGKNCFERAVK
jgi:hypothetical protein